MVSLSEAVVVTKVHGKKMLNVSESIGPDPERGANEGAGRQVDPDGCRPDTLPVIGFRHELDDRSGEDGDEQRDPQKRVHHRIRQWPCRGLGGTRWEMLRIVIGQHCLPGIFGATVLGLGRALGETMAVTMVIGNRPEIFASLFRQGYSMAAVIANEFAEADGLQLSSLVLIGLLLMLVTLVVNLAAKGMLSRMVARASRGI